MSEKERIEIVRDAIMMIRRNRPKTGEGWPGSKGHPLTYGFIGLLDYILSGDPEKILDSTLKRVVRVIIKGKGG